MNRRGFLGAILAAGVAPAVVKASSLMPVLVRKELGGLLVPEVSGMELLQATGGISMITKEALIILERNLVFANRINASYARAFNVKHH